MVQNSSYATRLEMGREEMLLMENSSYAARLEMGREEILLMENRSYASRSEMDEEATAAVDEDHEYEYIPFDSSN